MEGISYPGKLSILLGWGCNFDTETKPDRLPWRLVSQEVPQTNFAESAGRILTNLLMESLCPPQMLYMSVAILLIFRRETKQGWGISSLCLGMADGQRSAFVQPNSPAIRPRKLRHLDLSKAWLTVEDIFTKTGLDS